MDAARWRGEINLLSIEGQQSENERSATRRYFYITDYFRLMGIALQRGAPSRTG